MPATDAPGSRRAGGTRILRRARRLSPWLSVLVLVTSVLVGARLSLLLGQDVNWDLRNYHYYNAYAFLTGRLGWDYAPASVATYFNPLLDVPFYLLMRSVRPIVVGLVLGAIHGVHGWLLFLIGRRIIGRFPAPETLIVILVAAGLGMYGAASASELGTMFHDLTLAIPVLAAFLLGLRSVPTLRPVGLVVAGALLGLAIGLKPTMGIYAPGMFIAGLAMTERRAWPRVAVLWGSGLVIGGVITGGYWAVRLYAMFRAPLGPVLNSVFKSPYFDADTFDDRFFPRTLIEWLFYPFFFRTGRVTAMELPFQDLRFALVYCLIVAVVATALWRRVRGRAPARPWPRAHLALVLFFVVSFPIWELAFSIYRYLVPLELLAPVVIYVLVTRLVPRRRYRAVVCLALFVLVAGAVRAPDWGRLPWGQTYFGVQAPPLEDARQGLVLMTTYEALAFVIPDFPRDTRFIRVQGVFEPTSSTRLAEQARAIIEAHPGPLFLLSHSREVVEESRRLAAYGLEPSWDSCVPVKNRVDPRVIFCALHRIAPARP
jgi:hypothetical protein